MMKRMSAEESVEIVPSVIVEMKSVRVQANQVKLLLLLVTVSIIIIYHLALSAVMMMKRLCVIHFGLSRLVPMSHKLS